MKISNKMKITHRVRGNLYRDIYFDLLTERNYQRDQVMKENIETGRWTFSPMNDHILKLLNKRIKQYEDYKRATGDTQT